jgi:hypothetical protein
MSVHTWIIFLGPLSSLISAVLSRKQKTNIDIYLIATFFLMLAVEIVGYFLPRLTNWQNYFVYNSYTLVQFVLYLLVFYTLTISNRWKRVIISMSIGLILFFVWDNFYEQQFFIRLQFKTFILGCLFTIICTIRYLMNFLQTDEVYDFYRSRSFWFCCGMLVFCIPFIPIIVSYEYLLFDKQILNTLRSLLIVFMHICFIIAFRWTIRR